MAQKWLLEIIILKNLDKSHLIQHVRTEIHKTINIFVIMSHIQAKTNPYSAFPICALISRMGYELMVQRKLLIKAFFKIHNIPYYE